MIIKVLVSIETEADYRQALEWAEKRITPKASDECDAATVEALAKEIERYEEAMLAAKK